MKISSGLICTSAIAAAVAAGACSQSGGDPKQGSHSALGATIANAMNEARAKLRTENIDISSGHMWFSSDRPSDSAKARERAAITPKGDLLIGGRAIAIDAQQRALLMEYRGEAIEIAEAGMDIGTQAVDLATHAVGKALDGVFSGKSDKDVGAQVESEAADIKQAAAKLCAKLPAMRDTQQKLAASLPAFAPYATMTQADIDDCMKNAEHNHVHVDGGS